MKKFLVTITIIIGILGVIALLIAFNFKTLVSKFVSYNSEKSIESQVSKQYDEEKKTNTKNDINIEQFRDELSKMDNSKYEKINKIVESATIKDIQKMYDSKELTCEELVIYYLKNIEKYDINKLNSIIELNPDVIEIAKEKDKEGKKGKLYGIPINLKANIGTGDKLHTTAGSYALKDSLLDEDAFIVKRLREEGAIILGKSNLSEFAYYMSNEAPSGYSSLGGQTHNPYGKFDVGGSSSGSAVSVSSGFSVASIGTETAGSMIYPSSQNSVVGLKPTIGLVSRDRIIPIVEEQDTAGVIAKNVEDTAIILNVISGYDKKDAETENSKKYIEDYAKYTTGNSVNGLKVAIVRPLGARAEEDEILNRIQKEFEGMGASVTNTAFSDEASNIDMSKTLESGFKYDINSYLKAARVKGINSLNDIIEYNKKDLDNRAPFGEDLLEKSEASTASFEDYKNTAKKNRDIGRKEIDNILKDSDVIVSLSNQLSAVYAPAGYPALTVPAGYKSTGEPIGVTFVGSRFQEGKLINIGNIYEKNTNHRKVPNLK